jgi:putative ABC transport system permease protein
MIFGIPIAWLQLTHQKVRLLATLAGVSFVVILLFMQLGFRTALFDSAVRVHQQLDADLFMLSPQYQSLTSQQSFPRDRLYQTLNFEGVKEVAPLYLNFAKLRHPESGEKFSIFMFGIDPGKRTFKLPEINQNLDKIKPLNRAIFDRESRDIFGPIVKQFEANGPTTVQIAPFNTITEGYRYRVDGIFSLGPSFGVDGNLIVSATTLFSTFIDRTPDKIDIGLIRLNPGIDSSQIKEILKNNLRKDVNIMTREEFITYEKNYWDVRTPSGFVFRMMVVMGFVIGTGIIYQVLYTNIANCLTQYATLKAIGHTQFYLLGIVFQQALFLAAMGYIPGLLVSYYLYDVTRKSTQLPLFMTPSALSFVFVSVLAMCIVSGVAAVNKLRRIDPAEIF